MSLRKAAVGKRWKYRTYPKEFELVPFPLTIFGDHGSDVTAFLKQCASFAKSKGLISDTLQRMQMELIRATTLSLAILKSRVKPSQDDDFPEIVDDHIPNDTDTNLFELGVDDDA